jgi:hypothetical protein
MPYESDSHRGQFSSGIEALASCDNQLNYSRDPMQADDSTHRSGGIVSPIVYGMLVYPRLGPIIPVEDYSVRYTLRPETDLRVLRCSLCPRLTAQ